MVGSFVQVTRQAESSSPRGRTSPVVDVSLCGVTSVAWIFPLHFDFEFWLDRGHPLFGRVESAGVDGSLSALLNQKCGGFIRMAGGPGQWSARVYRLLDKLEARRHGVLGQGHLGQGHLLFGGNRSIAVDAMSLRLIQPKVRRTHPDGGSPQPAPQSLTRGADRFGRWGEPAASSHRTARVNTCWA